MPEKPSHFVWYDLMTSDPAAATAFYRDVIGWQAQDAGMAGSPYTLLTTATGMVGGVMSIPEESHNASPGWLGHIGVDDVDAYAARITEAGGVIHRAPRDIPDVGRFAVASDPHGAVFLLFQALQPMSGPDRQVPPPLGHVAWHELYAGDLKAAWEFYSGLFGWTADAAIDMGPMGLYQTFSADGVPTGGMMTKPLQMPAPWWLYYIHVEGVGATLEKIKGAGGEVIMDPRQVPGGGWIAQCLDPQGALFAITGKE